MGVKLGLGEMSVRFLGSGAAFGSGGRMQTCIFVESGEARFLIDCEATSLVAMKRFGVDLSLVDFILLTHLHGDHFGGIPFFVLESQFVSRRTRPLLVAGPPGTEGRMNEAMELMFPGSSRTELRFPLEFVELSAGVATGIGPVVATPYEVNHPSGAPAYALRVEVGEKIISYSGDTEWTESLIHAAHGADLFICECYSLDKKIPYHLDYETLTARREELECDRLILTHMSGDMLDQLEDIDAELAEDGKIIVF